MKTDIYGYRDTSGQKTPADLKSLVTTWYGVCSVNDSTPVAFLKTREAAEGHIRESHGSLGRGMLVVVAFDVAYQQQDVQGE